MNVSSRVLVTGADGFVGRNLIARLADAGRFTVLPIVRRSQEADWREAVAQADAVVHLASVTRSSDEAEIAAGNLGTTQMLIALLEELGRAPPVIFASSTKADNGTGYGRAKKSSEAILLGFVERTGAPLAIYRLPHVFGRWARSNYNSIVVTLCHAVATGRAVAINDRGAPLRLNYIDNVVDSFIDWLEAPSGTGYHEVAPLYETTVGDVEVIVRELPDEPGTHTRSPLESALSATYRSFLPAA